MKGKIIVLDNTVKETRDMIVKENYILAHSSNVTIGLCTVRRAVGAEQVENQLDYGL